MGEDRGFLPALRGKPEDKAPRLVYADWLEEHGDPRGEYLRLVCALDSLPPGGRDAEKLRERLHELQGVTDPQWAALVLAGRVPLRYHWRTFALLNEKPVLSKAN